MEISFFLRGLVIGFAIAVPVGPINILCIRRTIADGRTTGFISGLGAATADTFYGCIAGFGLTFVSDFLADHTVWFRIIGGVFLCGLGITTSLAKPSQKPARVAGTGLTGAYVSTFFLTLTNPMTILAFAAMFAGMGVANASVCYLSGSALVLGVLLGSSLWWLTLTIVVGAYRHKFSTSAIRWVNRAAGLVITGFGIVALLSAVC